MLPPNESTFLRHEPCPSCGSSDANSVYSDNHAYCFKCGNYTPGDGEPGETPQRPRRVAGLIDVTEVSGLRLRKITDETCKHFNYGKGTHDGRPVQIAPYYNADGQLVAQHIRFPDKGFAWRGDSKEAMPFGAQAFPKTERQVVVTEGEIDAMSMSQAQGNKWPVVSIGCGAGPQVKKYFARHRDYFSGFEKVVLMFDMDEPGRAGPSRSERSGDGARVQSAYR